MSGEQWRPILSLPGYEASDLGRVRSVPRVIETVRGPRRMPGCLLTQGRVARAPHLRVRAAGESREVHGLVAEAWLGPRPPGTEVCHGSGGQQDNRPSNLRYDTRQSNALDAVRDGTHANAAKVVCPRGHRLVEPNLRAAARRRGWRVCLACSRTLSAADRAGRSGLPWSEQQMQRESDRRYGEIMRDVDQGPG